VKTFNECLYLLIQHLSENPIPNIESPDFQCSAGLEWPDGDKYVFDIQMKQVD